MTSNPLLSNTELPLFSQIKPEHIEPALDQVLTENRARIADLLTNPAIKTWNDLVPPLEMLEAKLQKVWSPISHLHAVRTSDELRTTYHACLPKLTAYHTEILQNKQLYQAFENLANSAEYEQLNVAQKKVIENHLRDFHLAGVTLPHEAKIRYAEIQTRMAKLTTEFEENVLDATESWTKQILNIEELAGIPQHVLNAAKETAQQKKLNGWVLTLEYPCYLPILSYASNRELRREMYTAYVTRASDQGPLANQFDNSAIMSEIIALRHELSNLLGFANYAEYSLATKMIKQPQQVVAFLNDLVKHAHPQAQQELKELSAFALKEDNLSQLEPWDIPYYSEKLCKQSHGIDDELLRPYFPQNRVLEGMFTLIKQLYGMQVVEEKSIDTWHPEVRFFSIYDREKNLRGQFYLDLYARAHKRGGAWMDDCKQRWVTLDGKVQTPVAFLTCNLTPPEGNQPALLTHDEVITLFHEFGHGLHHMLTKVDYLDVAGIHGVEWDAVEQPSQFMEFFVWEKSVLPFVSGHYQTGEPLPLDWLQRLQNAKNFQTGLRTLRQLEFALFDFHLHLYEKPSLDENFIQNILDQVRRQVTVIPITKWNRFQHSFTHVFSGGYAAGYYSYLWAEMLASDAFAKFEEAGVLNPDIGQEFLTTILEKGGTCNALELFVKFRGRDPNIKALLRHLGLN